MPDADGVLAAIDSCLDDCAVSDDAMRWAPDEPDLARDGVLGATPTLTFVDEGVTAYFAVAPPDGEQPQWQPLGCDVVSDLTFARDEDYQVAENFLSMPRTFSITLHADTSEFRRGLLEALCAAFGLRWDRRDRLHAIKSEYRRRRRNRR